MAPEFDEMVSVREAFLAMEALLNVYLTRGDGAVSEQVDSQIVQWFRSRPRGLRPKAKQYVGANALEQAWKLVVLGHDSSGWETFLCSADQEDYWLLTYPNSTLHGGGQPVLSRSSLEAWLHNQALQRTASGGRRVNTLG